MARIVVSLQCHKHDMKASFEYTGYYPFWLLFMYPYVKVVEKKWENKVEIKEK